MPEDRPLDLRSDRRERVAVGRQVAADRGRGIDHQDADRGQRDDHDQDHVVGLVAVTLEDGSGAALAVAGRAIWTLAGGRPRPIGPRLRANRTNRGCGARFIGRLPRRREAASSTIRLERGAAGGVVDEHVEAGCGRAQQDRRGRIGAEAPTAASGDERLAGDGVGEPDRVVEAVRSLDRSPGRPPRTASTSSGPLSPIRTAAVARSATASRGRAGPRPCRDHRRSARPVASNARRAAMTASGWVPMRVVDEADAIHEATVSSRCSTPRNAAAAVRIAVGARPNRQPDRDGRERIADVVRARDRELGRPA